MCKFQPFSQQMGVKRTPMNPCFIGTGFLNLKKDCICRCLNDFLRSCIRNLHTKQHEKLCSFWSQTRTKFTVIRFKISLIMCPSLHLKTKPLREMLRPSCTFKYINVNYLELACFCSNQIKTIAFR